MISQLSGTVTHKDRGYIVLDVHGVGYKLALSQSLLASTAEHEDATFWTHLAVREDVLDLYGFASKSDLVFFEQLVSVSGIGPKSALGIMNLAPIEELTRAIQAWDANYLTKVSGIGKKTAAKIILELKEKIEVGREETTTALREDIEALEALHALGYSLHEARTAIRNAGNAENTQAKIKAALKLLAR